MSEWKPIETAPDMRACLLFHPYFSHGRVRHAYRNRKCLWVGVNADGTEHLLGFEPTHWMPLPEAPEASDV